jgi:predicted metal-dependent HD superfamily phosphohydrolase
MTSKRGSYGMESAYALAQTSPAYWKTLAGLCADNTVVTHDGSALVFENYVFEPASIFPHGRVEVDLITEISFSYPPQVRLINGEILFVPQTSKLALIEFINAHDVPVVRRRAVWGDLLDPFVDTSEDQDTIDNQFAWFASIGLTRSAVDEWRKEVAVAMIAYNFGTGLWEWGGLDLHDVLQAQRAGLSKESFAQFYARAMQLATMDQVLPRLSMPGAQTLESALSSVLIDWFPREEGSGLNDFDQRWMRRSERIDALKQSLLSELIAKYTEPHRCYHTAAHIEYCLRTLSDVWQYAVHLNEVRWAILFHDAIYDPKRNDNEALSADWACKVMAELGRPKDVHDRVHALIMSTAHNTQPRTPDEALLVDIDLAILGADDKTFDEYDFNIRKEYEWVPKDLYRESRIMVLESFTKRDKIYATPHFRRMHEAVSRENIRRAIEVLRVD